MGGWQVVVTDGNAVLPEGMTHLPDHAFQDFISVVSVTFPRSLTSIGEYAFYSCSALSSVTFPAGLTSIGVGAFFRCSTLTSVTFPAGLTSTTLLLPDGLSTIGDCGFFGCPLDDEAKAAVRAINFWAVQPPIDAQGHATVPEGLTSVCSFAFYNCSSLVSVTLPPTLTSIGRRAFSACSSLTSISFPAGLTTIGFAAFAGCPSLTRVTVPTTATTGLGAFPPATTVLRLPPAKMRWYEAVDFVLAYKRCRPLLYGWLERAQIGLGSYGPDGAARKRDREEFEGDFGHGAAAGSSGA